MPTGQSAPAAFPTPSHTHPRLPQLGPGLQGSRQGWGVAPGAEATTPTSRGACGVSRGMFRQVGVSPAPFPLQGPRENSPFPPTPQRQQAGEEAGEEAVEASYSSTPNSPTLLLTHDTLQSCPLTHLLEGLTPGRKTSGSGPSAICTELWSRWGSRGQGLKQSKGSPEHLPPFIKVKERGHTCRLVRPPGRREARPGQVWARPTEGGAEPGTEHSLPPHWLRTFRTGHGPWSALGLDTAPDLMQPSASSWTAFPTCNPEGVVVCVTGSDS